MSKSRREFISTVAAVSAAAAVAAQTESASAAVADTRSGKYEKYDCLKFELKDRKSTRLNSSHIQKSRMPSSA